jgi:voltage-gated potassium channel
MGVALRLAFAVIAREMFSDRIEPMPTVRERIRIIIFEAETPAGRFFDVALLFAILGSILAVSLESVTSIRMRAGPVLVVAEWFFTIGFTIEYVLRLYCIDAPARYARSFFGLVDLLAVLPTYLSFLIPGAQGLTVVRVLRLLRVFRVLKLARFLGEANILTQALHSSRHKVAVFLGTVSCIVIIMGSAMYLIEGPEAGFTSIPRGMYWAIVTMTTVGYGDIAPQSVPGQSLAAILMIMGYAIIAVPTGIVSAEIIQASRVPTTRACAECSSEGHDWDARYCKDCGGELRRAVRES